MRTPIRRPTARQLKIGLRLALVLLLAVAGWLLLRDRAGLRAEYFALGSPWEGSPFHTTIAEPRLASASEVGEALLTKVVFSLRWSGWWAVRQAGEHRFSLDADDGGYLRIDGELVVDTDGVFGEPLPNGRKELEPGLHAVEIGLYQTYGASHLRVYWSAPGSSAEETAPLPLGDLYAARPLLARQVLRRLQPAWPRIYRQLLGVGLLLAAVLLLRGLARGFEPSAARLRARVAELDGRGLRAALLVALFVCAFFLSLPFTGTVQGGDDTAYLSAANFSEKSWFFNRYAHVYLLKLFNVLSGGPLEGVRVWWSFVFAATVSALAVAVGTLGPGLQLRTLAATLFILLSQTTLFGLIGAGFADFSAMMFVTAAVATCLHGLASARRSPQGGREWHALAIGALTVAALRSKEVGAVLLVLPIFFLIENGALDLRRFARKMAYWLAGALGALSTLVLLDGWLLGEFLFTFDSGRLAASKKMNFPDGLPPRKTTVSWLQTIWSPQVHAANHALRNLWLGVCAAALAAGLRRRRLELRLLHLLPVAYLLALIALYVRMPHPISTRMLIPMLPVACLMTALLLYHAGLEEVSWGELLEPLVLIPAALSAAVLFLILIPYRLGTLDTASLLPATLLSRYGWQADHFVLGVLLPAGVLVALAGVVLIASRRQAWVAALLVATIAFFGVGFEITRESLAKKLAAQTGELLTYPWRTFRDELNAAGAQKIALSRDLRTEYRMTGVTRTSLAAVSLGRRDLAVYSKGGAPVDMDAAIASRYAYDSWLRQAPALAETATFDSGGFLVLVRPKEAARLAAERPELRAGAETPAQTGIEQRLVALRASRDPEAREELLRNILDSAEGPERVARSIGLQELQGDRLRAVNLWPDGWTDGTSPAALILRNSGDTPLVQQIRLTVHAPAAEYPIRAFVDDGGRMETLRFDRGRTRKVRLRPVPQGSSRLVIIWSDKAWAPKNENDDRRLGVRIRPVPERQAPERQAPERQAPERQAPER